MFRRSCAFFFLFLAMTAVARADHDLDTYSFENIFVFDTFTKKFERSFNVVVLDDAAELKIAGSAVTKADGNVDAYAHFQKYLIVLIWKRVEIYSLEDPARPVLVKTYVLHEHKPWSGGGRIIKEGRKLYLFSTRATAVLTMGEDMRRWKLENIERTLEMQEESLKKAVQLPFNFGLRDKKPYVIRETEQFVYEIVWKIESPEPYVTMYKKYLLKVRRNDGAVMSELYLGEIRETGGG